MMKLRRCSLICAAQVPARSMKDSSCRWLSSRSSHIQRMQELEGVANRIEGVDKAFAMQAGRELRVVVKPEKINDAKAHKVARDIKNNIEKELQYPGTIKVTVIRETRAVEEAK